MANIIARTGRVQSWIDDPESRLPVSCTVFVVEDSIEGPKGLKHPGALFHTPYVLALDVQYTYQI